MFAAIDDCSLLPSGALRKGMLSEWFYKDMSKMKTDHCCAVSSVYLSLPIMTLNMIGYIILNIAQFID